MKPITDVVKDARDRVGRERLAKALRDTTAAHLRAEPLERLEFAYREAAVRREKCSREDFAAGYIAALLSYGHTDLFAREES